MTVTWETCIWCDPDSEDGAVWPVSAFGACGSAYPKGERPCDSCFVGKYPRRRTRCSDCNKRMETRGKGPATCRDCRRAKRPEPAYRFAHVCECGRRSKQERCYGCRRKAERQARVMEQMRRRLAQPKPMKGGVTFVNFRFERAA